MSINRVCISGNLTRDPELRGTGGGTSVLSFGMAVNDRRQNPQTQQWEDYANFVDVTIFGNRAQSLSSILRKGMKVTVDGRLHYSSWQTQDGQRRSKLEVIANEVDLPPRQAQQPQAHGGGYQQPAQQPVAAPAPQAYPQQGYARPAAQGYAAPTPPPAPAPQRQQPPAMDVYDEDIPF